MSEGADRQRDLYAAVKSLISSDVTEVVVIVCRSAEWTAQRVHSFAYRMDLHVSCRSRNGIMRIRRI